MSPEARCECCDLPAYSCGKALEQAAKPDAPTGRTVEAQFNGKCVVCGEWYRAGTLIGWAESGWACCS